MYTDYEYTHFVGDEPDFERELFLEIEGVLNSESYFRNNPDLIERLREIDNPGQIESPASLLDPDAVEVLADVVEAVGPTVVLTSIWREYYSLAEVESFLRERGYTGDLDAFVQEGDQIDPSKNEIIMWCEDETDPMEFLVVDPAPLRGIDNQLLVDSTEGLTAEDGRAIVEHFESS